MRDVGLRDRAVERREAHRIVRHVAPAIGRVGGGIADIRRPGIVERGRDRGAHAFALGEPGALLQRRHPARIGAGERAAEREASDAVGIFRHVEQRLHGGGRDGDEMIGRGQSALLQHRFEIGHQDFGGDVAHLLGESRAALVVAQRAVAPAQRRKDAVPARERAAHFMQKHDRGAAPGEFVVNADAVGVHPGQGRSSRVWPA